jgi:fucose permease
MIALLVIIYAAFVSLGLPDNLLGSAWPTMYPGFQVSDGMAGSVSMIISAGTIISSLNSDRLTKKLGTGKVTVVSTALTAAALLGFSTAPQFWMLWLLALPLGLGAGAIDAGLNNFVALHYKAIHMNWLHASWGIGAAAGPVLMGSAISATGSWRTGYLIVACAQAALALVLLASLPLWRQAKNPTPVTPDAKPAKSLSIAQLVRLPKAKSTMLAFFGYCAVEASVMLWAATYLVMTRGVGEDSAAFYASFYVAGITAGRILAGFAALKLTQRALIGWGAALMVAGLGLVLVPVVPVILVGLVVLGVGSGPIFPNLLHETPRTFSPLLSQSFIGVEMSAAYVGILAMPPLFGLIGRYLGYQWLPLYLGLLLALMVLGIVYLYRNRVPFPVAE